MGFGEGYLRKAALREAQITQPPHEDTQIIITIPVYRESRLEQCLDSLFSCQPVAASTGHPGGHVEVLILINAARDEAKELLRFNETTLAKTLSWIDAHRHPQMTFHLWLDHSFSRKEAGVGSARKILMDEAVRRFNSLGRPGGLIASLDADAVVDPDYLQALHKHFDPGEQGAPEACSIYFEHPLERAEDPFVQAEDHFAQAAPSSPDLYTAIARYELHLRYYLWSLRHTGFPHAFHTVGSAFAVRADIYVLEGGMNRRKGGEDFYFIQKVARRGRFSTCTGTRVVPSPRASDRVPFGTGPAIRAQLEKPAPTLLSYHPEPFAMLPPLLLEPAALFKGDLPENLAPVLLSFLEEQQFTEALAEMRGNAASPRAFAGRFLHWFNMFRIMKFLHYARERAYPDVPVEEAAWERLRSMGASDDYLREHAGLPGDGQVQDIRGLLSIYRRLDRLWVPPPGTHPHPLFS